MTISKWLLGLIACLVTTIALAQAKIEGKWSGKVNIGAASLSKAPKDQRAAIEASLKKVVIMLTLKAGGKYTNVVTDGQGKKTTTEGNWKLAGKVLTLTRTKLDGKANANEPQKMLVSSDGKAISMKEGDLTILFRRA